MQRVKDDLGSAFGMKDLGGAKRILDMNIVRNRERKEIWLIKLTMSLESSKSSE